MATQGFWDNPDRANERVAILKQARGIVESLDEVVTGLGDLDVYIELAEGEGEAGVKELERTVDDLEEKVDALELRTLLSGRYDDCGALITIQSGAGGTDASDWAEMLLRMYGRWAERAGFKAKLLDALEHEEAGIKWATLQVTGPLAFGYLSAEMGVHRLVRISPFDAQGRRQTSFAAVDVIPDIEEDEAEPIDEKDLRIDTYRAGGKGGQHVNKTESAVRITHAPSGLVVQCQSERSQHKNKATAMKMLAARLAQLKEMERTAEIQSLYDNKGQIAWGNQIRSYVMAPYTLVKDHRTSHETGNVQAVLDGDIQGFIESYLKHRAKAKR
jgi:peptide chain release factor 2